MKPGLYVYEPEDGYDHYYYIHESNFVFSVTPMTNCVLSTHKAEQIVEHCRYVVDTHLVVWLDHFLADMEREIAERQLLVSTGK